MKLTEYFSKDILKWTQFFTQAQTVIGIDPSIRNTGYCIYHKEGDQVLSSGVFSPSNSGILRLKDLAEFFEQIFTGRGFIVMEGGSFGSVGRVYDLGKVSGIAELKSFSTGVSPTLCVSVPPTTLKKFATGKGNSKKENMLLSAFKHYGKEFNSNDEVDAFFLSLFGACMYKLMVNNFAEEGFFERDKISYTRNFYAYQTDTVSKYIKDSFKKGNIILL